MGLILLGLNILHAVADAIPAMAKAFVDVRQAMRETTRVGKKHVRKAVNVGKRKFKTRRNRYERAKARRR